MIFENLNLEKVILSETFKRRTWFKTKAGDQMLICHRTYKEILDEFPDECEEELKGLYRNHQIELSEYQEAWKDKLNETQYSFFLSIKLPHTNKDGFIRTRNKTESMRMLKIIIQDLLTYYGGNNWRRNPPQWVMVQEHGKSGFWHIHIAIPTSENDVYVAQQLCRAVTQVINKHQFYKTTIDLRYVHDNEGLCIYMVKELRQKEAEGSEIFYLYNLFKGIKKNRYIVKLSLRALRLLIRAGLWIKQASKFNILNPIKYIKKKLLQKRFNRTGGKVNASANFDSS